MNERKITDDISIVSNVTIDQMLLDLRFVAKGAKFGKVSDVAKQFGVKIAKEGPFLKFTAPRNRLEKMVEKLHFSRQKYWDAD